MNKDPMADVTLLPTTKVYNNDHVPINTNKLKDTGNIADEYRGFYEIILA
jgi:hypothetical protein